MFRIESRRSTGDGVYVRSGFGTAGPEPVARRVATHRLFTHVIRGLRQDGRMRRLALLLGILALVVPATAQADPRVVEDPSAQPDVEQVTIRREIGSVVLLRSWYASWNGRLRTLLIAYPRTAPAQGVPLLVTNHPAGMSMICTDEVGLAAARAGYALTCLSGQGVVTRAFSYGSAGQIADLARAPQLVDERIPDIRLDASRQYLAGSSMGGTEALLVALRYPSAYDGVASLDPVTDLARRHRSLPLNRRVLLEAECGGTPAARPDCYAIRSPIGLVANAQALPSKLMVWYSDRDPVSGEPLQVPAFVEALRARSLPGALDVRVGDWGHGALWDRTGYRRAWLQALGLPAARAR
jgi:pimeloyl-ACP methyl ester carboxylesterase